jgi:hypothetical protein
MPPDAPELPEGSERPEEAPTALSGGRGRDSAQLLVLVAVMFGVILVLALTIGPGAPLGP